jgi:cell division protein FtsQ
MWKDDRKMRKNRRKKPAPNRRQKIILGLGLGLKIGAAITGLILVSTLCILGYDVLTQCEYFTTQKIAVDGQMRLSPRQVQNQALVHEGINLLSINLTTSRKRLLAHPWIKQARVRRELPDRIRISIEEHQPLAIIDLGRHFLINTDGEIFKAHTDKDPQDLPLITGLNLSQLNLPGDPKSEPFEAVMTVLKLGQAPGSVLPNHAIRRIQVDTNTGLTLFAFDQLKAIDIGYDDYPAKFGRLRNVMYYLRRNEAIADFVWIDLNNLKRVVINPLRTETPVVKNEEV